MTGPESLKQNSKDLWGWTDAHAAGRACLLALEVKWTGAEVMYIVAEDHCAPEQDSESLAEEHYPTTVLRKSMGPNEGYVLSTFVGIG